MPSYCAADGVSTGTELVSRSWRHSPWIPAAMMAVITFAYRFVAFEGFSNDHYLHLARAQQWLMGELPVRDFLESGLPLMSGFSAFGQIVGGPGLFSEIVLTCALFATGSALTYVVAYRLSGSVWLAVAAAAMLILAYPVSYSYPKVLPYAAVFVGASGYFARPTNLRLALLSALVVFAFMLRHDHGLILGVGSALAVFVRHGARCGWAPLVRFFAISLLLAAPYLLWVQRYEGLVTYVREGAAFTGYEFGKATWSPPSFSIDESMPLVTRVREFRGPVIHIRWAANLDEGSVVGRESAHGVRRLDEIGPRTWQYELTRWSTEDLRSLVSDAAVADTDGIDRHAFTLVDAPVGDRVVVTYHPEAIVNQRNGATVLYYLAWVLPALALVMGFVRRREGPPGVLAMTVLLVVVQLLINRSMLRDPLTTRTRDVVAPAAVLLVLFAARVWQGMPVGSATVPRRMFAGLMLVIALAGAAAAGDVPQHLRDALSGRIGGYLVAGTRAGPLDGETRELVEYLSACSPPGSRLLGLTFAPELFFYTGHGFAGGVESLVPGFYTSERDTTWMLDHIQREDVPFAIMDTETSERIRTIYRRLVDYVDGRFREVARFLVAENKYLIVLADTQRMPVRRFGARSLPCFDSAHSL